MWDKFKAGSRRRAVLEAVLGPPESRYGTGSKAPAGVAYSDRRMGYALQAIGVKGSVGHTSAFISNCQYHMYGSEQGSGQGAAVKLNEIILKSAQEALDRDPLSSNLVGEERSICCMHRTD